MLVSNNEIGLKHKGDHCLMIPLVWCAGCPSGQVRPLQR